MFSLFELAKLVNFSPEVQKTENSVSVRQIAWREVGDRSFLALLISNGYLLLRYTTHGSVPVVRQLPWHPDRPIQSMTFDPSATWLLCVTQKDVLYIVPALALLDPRAQIEHLWKLDDITRIRHRKRRGLPTCLAWWRSFSGDQIAVVGTKLGFVLFVDLRTERLVSETDVSEHVSNIDILYDESHTCCHALITTKSNSQWKILLETKDVTDGSEDSAGFTSITVSILQAPESRVSEFVVRRIQQFSSSTFLSPATINGKPRVAARDLHTKQLKIYNTALERSPICAYVIPEFVDEVVVTERLLFFSSTKESSSLELVSARLDHALPVTDQEDFNSDSVIQTFQLEGSEHILALFKRSFPFYWHEKREEERKKHAVSNVDATLSGGSQHADRSPTFHLSSHTVLDGCVVVTTHNVYECRPRVSPEMLFVEMAVSRSDQAAAEAVAGALNLQVSNLYYLAAQLQLSYHDYARASRFFQLAKSPHLQRVAAFAQYGRMSEVVLYLRQTLDCKQHELKSDEVGHLSDMMVLAYVQQLLEDKSRTNELTYDLREFLKTNRHYSSREAVDALVDSGFYELALDMGKGRQCLFEVLERLVNIGGSSGPLLEEGLHRVPFGKLGQIRHSALLQYLRPADLVRMLDDQPSFVLDFVAHFQTILADLDIATLRKVTQLFDISLPSYRKLIPFSEQLENAGSHDQHDQLSLTTSFDSGQTEVDDVQDPLEGQLKLIGFFVRCVILLNGRQDGDISLSFTQEAFTPLYTQKESTKGDVQYRLPVRRNLLSAGHQHSALVQDEQLYLWGDYSTLNRPQQETEKTEMWRPFTPTAFQSLRVTSVSCGAHHSMVITDDGVYGWGDCRYGQLGVGRVYDVPVRTPQRVEKLSDMHCVDIVCGHYHTVSLMEDCSVRSWGWGIHGQLGQGNAKDIHLPKTVDIPGGAKVCNIAAGYAHTLILTEPKGLVYATGCGVFGQLGLGTTCKHSTLRHIDTIPDGVISITTKDFHCVAVTSEGELYQWGASPNSLCDMVRDQRQARLRLSAPLVNLMPHQHYLKPTPVNTYNVVAKIIQVVCGSNFSALVTEDGEVFTWGRNHDGQLGIGNRTDQKTPVMVNRINDRKMAAVACGADHMVVMDTERQVWSWGRNDLGQLAVVMSQGSSTPGGQGIYVSMGIFAAVWPTKVPSINKITSPGPRRLLPLVTSTVGTGQWHVALPKLSPYTCDSLFTLLQYVPDMCDLGAWLQQCLDLKLWVTAGSLALRQGTLSLALHCHLSALLGRTESGTKTDDGSNRKTQLVFIAEYYLRQLGQMSTTNHKVHVQTTQDILCQLGESWVTENLDVALYTDLLSKHIQLVAWPFFLLMTRTDSQTDDVLRENTSSAASLSLQPQLLAGLGVTFCLHITQTVITLLTEEKIPGLDTSSLCAISSEALGLLPRHRMISPDKLWEEILHNVHKEATEAQSSIRLSAHQLETLTAGIDLPSATKEMAGGGESLAQTAVLFTCGHHMPRRTLLVEAVPQLELHLAKMDMPQSAALLSSQYAHKGAMAVACPKCVLNTIQTT